MGVFNQQWGFGVDEWDDFMVEKIVTFFWD
jgi:hypothetical protein